MEADLHTPTLKAGPKTTPRIGFSENSENKHSSFLLFFLARQFFEKHQTWTFSSQNLILTKLPRKFFLQSLIVLSVITKISGDRHFLKTADIVTNN